MGKLRRDEERGPRSKLRQGPPTLHPTHARTHSTTTGIAGMSSTPASSSTIVAWLPARTRYRSLQQPSHAAFCMAIGTRCMLAACMSHPPAHHPSTAEQAQHQRLPVLRHAGSRRPLQPPIHHLWQDHGCGGAQGHGRACPHCFCSSLARARWQDWVEIAASSQPHSCRLPTRRRHHLQPLPLQRAGGR
jgi:hypothetical protein